MLSCGWYFWPFAPPINCTSQWWDCYIRDIWRSLCLQWSWCTAKTVIGNGLIRQLSKKQITWINQLQFSSFNQSANFELTNNDNQHLLLLTFKLISPKSFPFNHGFWAAFEALLVTALIFWAPQKKKKKWFVNPAWWSEWQRMRILALAKMVTIQASQKTAAQKAANVINRQNVRNQCGIVRLMPSW